MFIIENPFTGEQFKEEMQSSAIEKATYFETNFIEIDSEGFTSFYEYDYVKQEYYQC